jgi:hypothetical protein
MGRRRTELDAKSLPVTKLGAKLVGQFQRNQKSPANKHLTTSCNFGIPFAYGTPGGVHPRAGFAIWQNSERVGSCVFQDMNFVSVG